MTPASSRDVDTLRRIGGDGSIFRYIPDIETPFDAARLLRIAAYNRSNSVAHLVRLRASLHGIGFIQVGVRRNAQVQIGYFFDRQFWGHGFAAEAIAATMAFLRGTGVGRPFHAAVHPDNIASLKVLERLGFDRLEPAAAGGGGLIEHVWPRGAA